MILTIQNHIMSEPLSSRQHEEVYLARQRQFSEFRERISQEVSLEVAEELGGLALRNHIELQVDHSAIPPRTPTTLLIDLYPGIDSSYLGYRRLVAAYGEEGAEDFLPGIAASANAWMQEFESKKS
jgi:hypothetical protein